VRGPIEAGGEARTHTLAARRYRCRHCGATVTVLARGCVPARHYGAGAIALAMVLYGLSGQGLHATRARVSPWRTSEPGWPSLGRWLDGAARGTLLGPVRAWPEGWSRRQQAERVGAAVLAAGPSQGALEHRVLAGALAVGGRSRSARGC
jgi:hypothetical protein